MDISPHLRDFIAGAGIGELQRLARVHGLVCDCDDQDELSVLVLSFFSSADRQTVVTNELRDAFPALRDEADLIASLLESTDLQVSHALLTQLAEMAEGGASMFTMLRLEQGGQSCDVIAQTPGALHARQITRCLPPISRLHHSAGVLAIESVASHSDRSTLPPAISFGGSSACSIAFAAIPAPSFGVVRARPLGLAQPSVRLLLQSPHFNFVLAAGQLQDELCWGCGGAFSSDLEAALIHLVIAVGKPQTPDIQIINP